MNKEYKKATCCHAPDCDMYDPAVCYGQVVLVAMYQDAKIAVSYHRCEAPEHDYINEHKRKPA